MRKIIFLLIVVMMISISTSFTTAKASGGDYMSYTDLYFEDYHNKLLYQYSDEELDQYDDKISGKKFMGWNAYYFMKHQKVFYTEGIKFMYKNTGSTAATYKFEFKEEKITKRSFSVTGSLDVSVKGEIKKLKAGLDTKLKIDYSETSTKTTRTTWSTNTQVDPGTTLKISIKGEGYVDQGVASKYFFWVRTKKGAFEIFNIATEYYCMEKVKV
ncbi:MAG: hypothetical protein J6Y28_06110 [Acholeplasmatales bacterium]|nr:hypothetical protein [Acholeplasmatales bacterium]